MVEKSDFESQKEKLLSDKNTVETRIKELDNERENLVSTLNALSGALQTVNYFLNKYEEESVELEKEEE